jgi:antitoxin YobK
VVTNARFAAYPCVRRTLRLLVELLDERISASSRARFARGVPETVVADAETVLGIRFPPSYRAWLLRYGSGYLGGYELHGLGPELPSERDPAEVYVGDVVYLAQLNRADGLPTHLLELLNYEGDEVYYLDLSVLGGEAPVVCREAGVPGLQIVADSFSAFLLRQL